MPHDCKKYKTPLVNVQLPFSEIARQRSLLESCKGITGLPKSSEETEIDHFASLNVVSTLIKGLACRCFSYTLRAFAVSSLQEKKSRNELGQ